jgi:ribonuclease-3
MASRSAGRSWGPLSRSGRRRRKTSDIGAWTLAIAGHEFSDKSLLDLSRSHRSWCSERNGVPSNERLEFLGDAILQWVITEWIYFQHPDQSEGVLSELRKSLVNTEMLAETARRIELGQWLLLGVGEDAAGGRNKASILADALEAFIGALYLDGGSEVARKFVLDIFEEQSKDRLDRLDEFDARSHLIRVCVREYARPPKMEISSRGVAHEPVFDAEVVVNGEVLGRAEGRTKKSAAQAASSLALSALEERGVDTGRA